MSLEENKAIVRRHLIDVLEQGHVELIDGYYAPDGSTPSWGTPQEWRDLVLWHHKAAPGFKIKILDMITESDKVATYWQIDMTFLMKPDSPSPGPFPTLGKPISWKVMTFDHIVDGMLVAMDLVNVDRNAGGRRPISPGEIRTGDAYKAAGADK